MDRLQHHFFDAIVAGDKEKVSEFVRRGADLHGRDDSGETALFYASMVGSSEMTLFLRELGATEDISRLLVGASVGDKPDLVRLFIAEGADVNWGAEENENALTEAVEWEHEEIVRILLSEGADPRRIVRGGITVRDIAARNGNEEIARLIDAALQAIQ